MRSVALTLVALLATSSLGWAQDADGAVCSTAQRAPTGTLAEVAQACSRALEGQATAADWAKMLRYRGIAQARGGNPSAAVADFDQVLQVSPNDTAALQGRGQSHEALGQRPQAAADYTRLATLQPNDTRWRIKVASLGGAAAPTAAAPATQAPQAMAQAPQAVAPVLAAPKALVPQAQVVAQAPQAAVPQTVVVAQAPQAAEQPVTRVRGTRAVTVVGGDGLVCAKALSAPASELPEVIRACSNIQAIQPTAADRARVLRYRGLALQRSGDPAAAIADFDQVLALTPADTWALQGRAESHEALGQVADAVADYGRLYALRPGDTRWRIKISQLGATPPPPVAAPPATATAQAQPQQAPAAPPPPPAPETVAEAPAAEPTPAADDPAALVRKVQTTLRALGYDVGAVNGKVGGKTRQAMDQFAAEVGLPTGGEADQEMLAAAEDALRHEREQVAQERQQLNIRAQQALVDLGYDIGDIDGVIGARSREALKAWSTLRGQPVTEIDQQVVASLEEAVVKQLTLPAEPTPAPATPPPAPQPVIAAPAPPASVPKDVVARRHAGARAGHRRRHTARRPRLLLRPPPRPAPPAATTSSLRPRKHRTSAWRW